MESIEELNNNNNTTINTITNGDTFYKLFLLLKEEQMKTRAGKMTQD
jgi:hypothetical protein